MSFPPNRIPRVPNHSGEPQNGQSYQVGDPGQAIGEIKSITTTFGQPKTQWSSAPPECTFVGTEGIARATEHRMDVVRFADVPFLLVSPGFIDPHPILSIFQWRFMNFQYAPLFVIEERYFGLAAEKAHAKFMLPRLVDAVRNDPQPLRFWSAQPTFVGISEHFVEVQQYGRYDKVKAQDLDVTMTDEDIILRCPAFYEARFMIGETVNALLLYTLLTIAQKG